MSTRKATFKKVFFIVSTLIIALTCLVYLFVIFGAFQFQKEMAERNIGEEIINIHKGVPRGWGYSIHTDANKIGEVGTLGKALAQVDFSLPDLNEKLAGDIQKRTIYFYPEAKFKQIEQELAAAKSNPQTCNPQYYSRTHEYVILTTTCDGFEGKQYEEFERKLKQELEEYWFRFK